MAHGDAQERKWRGNWRMECVASALHTTSELGVSSITTADAHTSAACSWMNWRPCRFKWTRPFRRETKSGFCAWAITFQTHSTFLGFRTSPDRLCGPRSLPYNGYRVFPGGKAAGTWRWPPTPSSAEVNEKVVLYLYCPSGPSWPVLGWILPWPSLGKQETALCPRISAATERYLVKRNVLQLS